MKQKLNKVDQVGPYRNEIIKRQSLSQAMKKHHRNVKFMKSTTAMWLVVSDDGTVFTFVNYREKGISVANAPAEGCDLNA